MFNIHNVHDYLFELRALQFHWKLLALALKGRKEDSRKTDLFLVSSGI